MRYRGETEGKWREFQDNGAAKSHENSFSASPNWRGNNVLVDTESLPDVFDHI